MSKTCTGCGEPTTDEISAYGLTLPYHPHCAIEAERDLRKALDRVGPHLAAWTDRSPACGSAPDVDEW
jgi:hypothetical protein